MISRLTFTAALFAVLTTTTLALAANSVQRAQAACDTLQVAASPVANEEMPVVQLDTVVITGHRTTAVAAR